MKPGQNVYLCENETRTPVVIIEKWTTFAKVRVIATGKTLTKSLMILEAVDNEQNKSSNSGS